MVDTQTFEMDDLRARRLASCRLPHRLGGASARTKASPMFPARPLRSVCVSVADMLAATGKDEGFGSAAGVIRFRSWAIGAATSAHVRSAVPAS